MVRWPAGCIMTAATHRHTAAPDAKAKSAIHMSAIPSSVSTSPQSLLAEVDNADPEHPFRRNLAQSGLPDTDFRGTRALPAGFSDPCRGGFLVIRAF
jgi:hypothetical protein